MAAPKKYPDELRARAVRLYRESDPKPVIRKLAAQLGVHKENAELHRANEILKAASAYFAAELDPTRRRS